MLRLTQEHRDHLLNRPESGMGYQFVEATLPDNRTKRGVAYNAELLLFEDEPRILLRTDCKTILRTAKSAAGEIKSLRFDPRPRPTHLRSLSAVKATRTIT
jgi:hypothetical protein